MPIDNKGVGSFLRRAPSPRHKSGSNELDAIIVPALCVDESGHRIGYGAGYYDRTLPKYAPPATTIAVAYDWQLVAEVPETEGDVRVGWVPCRAVKKTRNAPPTLSGQRGVVRELATFEGTPGPPEEVVELRDRATGEAWRHSAHRGCIPRPQRNALRIEILPSREPRCSRRSPDGRGLAWLMSGHGRDSGIVVVRAPGADGPGMGVRAMRESADR